MAWKNMANTLQMLSSLSGGWQQKGGGKALGKGKAAGKGNAKDEEFQCLWCGCKAAENRTPTKGGRETCHGCMRRKAAAKAPPIEKLVDWAFKEQLKAKQPTGAGPKGKAGGKGTKGGKAQQSSKDGGDDKTDAELKVLRLERLALLKGATPPTEVEKADVAGHDKGAKQVPGGTPAAPEAPKGEVSKPAKLPWRPRDLPCEAIDDMNRFQETFHGVVESVAMDLYPFQEDIPTPQQVVAELLAGSKETETAQEHDNLLQEVHTLKAQISLGKEGSDSDLALKALLVQQTQALARAEKKKPSSAVQSQSLVTVLGDWKLTLTQQEQRATLGSEKAAERRNERWTQFNLLEKALANVKSALQHHDLCYEEHHSERSSELSRRDTKVAELLTAKINEAKTKEQDDTIQKTAEASTKEAKGADAGDKVSELMLELNLAKQKAAAAAAAAAVAAQNELLERLRLLQQPAQPMDSSDETWLLSTDDTFEQADPKDLPEILDPSPDKLAACGHLHQLLLLWAQGGCQPVTFGQLRKHSMAGGEASQLLHFLLGERLWDGWFSLVTVPVQEAEAIPRQALMFAAMALDKLKTQYDAVETTRAAAAASYAAMAAESSAKRRRATAA